MWATGALPVVHISTAAWVKPRAGQNTPRPGCDTSRLDAGARDCKTGSTVLSLGGLRVGEHSRANRLPRT